MRGNTLYLALQNPDDGVVRPYSVCELVDPHACAVCKRGVSLERTAIALFPGCGHAAHLKCALENLCVVCTVDREKARQWAQRREKFIAANASKHDAGAGRLVHLLHTHQLWNTPAAERIANEWTDAHGASNKLHVRITHPAAGNPHADATPVEYDAVRAERIASMLGRDWLREKQLDLAALVVTHGVSTGLAMRAFGLGVADVSSISFIDLLPDDSAQIAAICDLARAGVTFATLDNEQEWRRGASWQALTALNLPYHQFRLLGIEHDALIHRPGNQEWPTLASWKTHLAFDAWPQ